MRTILLVGLIAAVAACSDGSLAGSAFDDGGAGGPDDASIGTLDGGQVEQGAPDGSLGASRGLPCDVAAIVDKHCALCHGDKPLYGAPMALRSHGDFHALAVTDPAVQAFRLVTQRLHDERSMPPPSQPQLSPADLAVLDEWLAHDAPKGSDVCAATDDAGVAAEPPFDWSQCDYDFELRAHGGQTLEDKTGYPVPLIDDHYECFNFAVPWDVDVHGLRFEPLVDQPRVVHHWLLYEQTALGAPAPGTHGKCGINRGFLATWTPGARADVLPDDVGMQMPAGSSMLQLELHYNNTRRIDGVQDRSGVRVCATSRLRPHSASVHKVGSADITLEPGKRTDVINTCTVASAVGDAHVISAFPHMHQLGRHFKTTVTRADGSVEVLTDTPFDFRYQGYVPTPFVIHQGDKITTTCTFENTTSAVVKSGEGTSEEMCYNHLLAWPPRSIANVPFAKDCIGLIPSSLH